MGLADKLDDQRVAKRVDLRGDELGEALEQAGENWAQLLAKGADAVIEEAGQLFLRLPTGELLKNGENEQWMLEYELNYWRLVKPPSDSTSQRLQETLFAPLAALRSNFDPSNDAGVWWATPEAVSVWGKTDSTLSASGRGDLVLWVPPDDVPEMGRLVEFTNALTSFPGSIDNDDARYIRHVDNEDGRNGRAMAAMDHPLNTSSFQRFGSFCGISRGCSGLVTCTFYLNEDWDEEKDGGEIRLFEPDHQRIKADVAPKMNRLVIFFSDSSVPHEVRRCRRERYAITTWYINQEMHLEYHQAEEEGSVVTSERHPRRCDAAERGEALGSRKVESSFPSSCKFCTPALIHEVCSIRSMALRVFLLRLPLACLGLLITGESAHVQTEKAERIASSPRRELLRKEGKDIQSLKVAPVAFDEYRFTVGKTREGQSTYHISEFYLSDPMGEALNLDDPNVGLNIVNSQAINPKKLVDSDLSTSLQLTFDQPLVVRVSPGTLVAAFGFKTSEERSSVPLCFLFCDQFRVHQKQPWSDSWTIHCLQAPWL
eukprot:g25091.t1